MNRNLVVLGAVLLLGSCQLLGMLGPNLTEYEVTTGWNIAEDGNGTLWTMTSSGLAAYDATTDEWTTYPAESHEFVKDNGPGKVRVIDGEIWFSYGWSGDEMDGIGVTRWNPDTNDFAHYQYQDTPNFPQGPVWEIRENPDGDVWVGTRFEIAAAWFDGTSWTQFGIEGGEEYFDCSFIDFDSRGRGYFQSWRGGLHVYDFNEEEWLHTSIGAVDGTESFLARAGGVSVTADGSEIIVVSRPWSNEISGPDGIWKYDGSEWVQTEPAEDEFDGVVRDGAGTYWSTSMEDYRVHSYDGSRWQPVDIFGYRPSEDDYLQPIGAHDGSLWLARVRDRSDEEEFGWNKSRLVRYEIP